ncbi:MAG: aldo/keto reductase [Actinomycetota bacterium]|nr:aldo/keto reductase [Actinomycetota bacterium]
MQQRHIGGRPVSAIGLGAMHLSTDDRPDEVTAISVIHAALDEGITLIDTADAYTPSDHAPGHNELIVAKALKAYGGGTDDVVVATKGGHTRDGAHWGLDGRPEYLRRAAEDSCRRLGVEAIDVYQHHRPDPQVPYEETIGALRDLIEAGLVRTAGISNADPGQIREAHRILGDGLVSVQNQFSPVFRSSEPELRLCEELGLAFLPWAPLGGLHGAKDVGSTTEAFGKVADKHGVSAQRVCLAWMLAKSPVVIPIPGASRTASVQDSAAAVGLALDEADLASLDAAA